jgi:hypothetical protein
MLTRVPESPRLIFRALGLRVKVRPDQTFPAAAPGRKLLRQASQMGDNLLLAV